MVLGFALTGLFLVLMIVVSLIQVRRVDRTIARIDAEDRGSDDEAAS